MNETAVLVGLLYGVISAVVCYVVSMITSGLFSRSFYQLYARVLIGICSVMLFAPGLRWLATTDPQLAALGLTLAQYAIMGVLGYGVLRFNRDHIKRLFLERTTVVYFTFGTLANAAVVTLAFLHMAITVTPSWQEYGQGYISASHYGPLLVILAAMVFHTDYHLKQSVGDLRRFGWFTFVGYAISFFGLALSMMPYLAATLSQLGLATIDSPLLENFFAAQALLIAIILFGWLVWRYESIPPLFLLLLAIVGQYHVLVTQWVIQSFGPASWGLASLPLFAAIASLEHYFTKWDLRKRSAEKRIEGGQTLADVPLRFAVPFRYVEFGLAIALLGVTLWTWASEMVDNAEIWLAATFVIYACFFAVMAVLRKESRLVYVSGLLAGLAALLGFDSPGGPMSAALLGALASLWGAFAFLGERGGLKLSARTPLSDCSLGTAIVVMAIVSCRHLVGTDPYYFQVVASVDALALGFAAIALIACAQQYRSWLPVFGVLIAFATMVPPWSAAIGLLATAAATLVHRSVPKENAIALDGRVRLLGSIKLPLEDVMPELYVQPLSMGAIPLALIGLLISASHVIQGNFAPTILLGAAASALVLLVLTRTYRVAWLYLLSLAATYFAVHAIAQGLVLTTWPASEAFSAHLLIAAMVSLCGWTVASTYASWCGALLRRVAEDREPGIRERRAFYAGLLYDMTSVMAGVTLAAVLVMWLGNGGTPMLLSCAAALTSVLFALAASVYRSQLGSYLSLAAITLAVLHAMTMAGLPRWDAAVVIAGLGLLAAAFSCLAWKRQLAVSSSSIEENASWKQPVPCMQATGLGLWLGPLAVYAMVCNVLAVVAAIRFDTEWAAPLGLAPTAPLTLAIAAAAFLLCTRALRTPAIYLTGIVLIYAASHASVAFAFDTEVLAGQLPLVHLVLAASLSLIGCCAATICSAAINRRLSIADDDRRGELMRNREFYAGIAHHFAFAAGCVVLLGLARSVVFDDLASSNTTLMQLCVGVLLAVTFSISGAIYRSRIQTYCALAAVCFGLHGIVAMLVPEVFRVTYQTLFVSGSALLFGVVSWLLDHRQHRRASELVSRYECFEQSPLPLVSTGASLWAKPLAHVSVLLAFLTLIFVGRDWFAESRPLAQVWLMVTPVYLAAAALFTATTTHQFGWLGLWLFPGTSEQEKNLVRAAQVERGVYYVISLITFGLGIHFTAWLLALETLPKPLMLSWHLCIGAVLALLGWSLATLYTFVCHAQMKATPDRRKLRQELVIYGGLLHHVVALTGVLVLAGTIGFGVPPNSFSAPLLASIGLLILYFGLASVTYRAQVFSYIYLLAVGVATLHLASLAVASWPTTSPIHAPAIACLSLVLVTLASFAAARDKAQPVGSSNRFRLPSPWSRPLPWSAGSLLAVWVRPLREASIFYAVTALMLMLSRRLLLDGFWSVGMATAVVTYLLVAGTFAVAARLYATPLLTYAAAIILTLATVPQMLLLGEPVAHLGIALAIVAMMFWVAGFAVEKYRLRGGLMDSEQPTSLLTRIYERPLIRCSTTLAVIAIAHSLLVWKMYGWYVSQAPIVVACALGGVTLLLNGRSLNLLQRATRARLMVYLACVSITGCSLAVTGIVGSPGGLGPAVALTALILGGVGLMLIESAKTVAPRDPSLADFRRTFGEPISHCASGLSILAVVVAMIGVVGSLGLSHGWLEIPAFRAGFDLSQLVPLAATMLIAAVVCLLSVRAQDHVSWLYAAVILGSGGICLLVQSQAGWSLGTATVGTLILMNSLVVLARIFRANHSRVESILGVSEANCERPFFHWPLAVTTALLVAQSVFLGYLIADTGIADTGIAGADWPWIWVCLLSGVLYFHVLYLQAHAAYVHLLVTASVSGVLAACVTSGTMLTPDVALAGLAIGWGLVAGLLDRPIGDRSVALLRLPLESRQREEGERHLLSWSVGLILLSLAATVPIKVRWAPGFPNLTLTLLLATLAGVIGGCRWRSVPAVMLSAFLFPVCLSSAMHYYGHQDLLFEFGGLIAACLALAYFGLVRIARRRGLPETSDRFLVGLESSLRSVSYALSCIAAIMAIGSVAQSSGTLLPALTMALASACWLWTAWTSDHEVPAYAAMIGFFVTVAYSGHVLLGIPLTGDAIATFFVIGFSFLLYAVNVLVSRAGGMQAKALIRPTFYLALALPTLLIVAIPLGDRTVAAFALLAAGAFYLLIARQSHVRWAMYVAAVLVNVAIYLWVPAARQFTGLYQLYVIPVAITVLIFAQLHRHELTARVLTSIRLAAAGAILAVSTFEVFFAEESSLLQFVAVLLLSLAGIASGIALRIRPFVSIGLAFLVINVVGQLGLQFHHEGGVVRAIILIFVGLLILAAMIFFNIHRERILQRYRGFLADKSWE